MYYFLYGEDTYRSRQKLKDLTDDLSKKREVFSFDASVESIIESAGVHIQSASLFSTLPGVVIRYPITGIPENKEFLEKEIENLKNSQAIFILWDTLSIKKSEKNGKAKRVSKKDKNDSEVLDLFLQYAEKSFAFSYLTNSLLTAEIKRIAEDKKVALSINQIQELAENFKGDLWAISHEIEKYVLTGKFQYQTVIQAEEKLYDFLDAIIEGNAETAFQIFEGVKEAKFEDVYIVSALAGCLRNMLKIKSLIPYNPDYRKYESFGMHPFVLKKTLSQVRRFRIEDLKKLYKKIIEADISIKTGNEDSAFLITRLITSFSHI